jgi:hypothetical protein
LRSSALVRAWHRISCSCADGICVDGLDVEGDDDEPGDVDVCAQAPELIATAAAAASRIFCITSPLQIENPTG